MAKKRNPAPRASTKAPDDGSPMGHLSDSDLLAELARRRAGGKHDLASMELGVEQAKREVGQASFAAMVAALPKEDGAPKACPRCGRRTPVKAHQRERRVLTLS